MKKFLLAANILCFAVFTSSTFAQISTHWRGPDSNGSYAESGLLTSWPSTGPEIAWSFNELGQGFSSAVSSGNSVYTSGMTAETGFLYKFSMDGKLIYKKAYGPEFAESYYGTRGTPVIAGDKIYILSGPGPLYCLNEKDGSLVWKKDLVADFGGERITWGYNETPVVDGNKIYCTPGGSKNCVVALNRNDGSLIWSCPAEKELSAYCTPLLFVHNGRKILATHTASHLVGIDAETGVMLWSQLQPNQYSIHANTPIYSNGELFYFSGYGQGSGKLILSPDGSSVKLAWINKSMDSRMGGAVLLNGYIYGSGDVSREWKCIDWKTGQNSYASLDLAKGAVICSDGLLFIYSEKGELAMVKANSVKFEILGNTRVTLGSEQHWAHPSISHGLLFVRHGSALIAYKIR
ncbi:MAG: PQQ-binding-like beta-propeller repeat protein [Bacteroidales bacterium]|nr:PQQ-binding-like beta-propeller repeat protein [Bacteroidales bacterium]MCB9012762.1 PQQ-binding-like beta-propeller repeat protein [Bacteroidales bacterium]